MLQICFTFSFFFRYIKTSKNISAKYYQESKERLQKEACESFQKRKEKKRQYSTGRYENLSEDEKQKLVEHRKKYYKMRKNALL